MSESWSKREQSRGDGHPNQANSGNSGRMRYRGFPLPDLIGKVERLPTYYCVTPIDDRGRVADRSALRAMQWAALQPIEYVVKSGIVMVTSLESGRWTITRQGHLRLPPSFRLAVGVRPVDRLLIAADLRGATLWLFTMDRLDRALGLPQLVRKDDGL